MPARRWFVLGLCAGLGACGFRPLLAVNDDAGVQQQLGGIEVTGLSGRLGQLVRNSLMEHITPVAALDGAPRYRLAVRLSRGTSALGIQLDNTITRYNLTVVARFQLLRQEDNQPLYRSTVRRVASYNVRREPFATLTAEQDAERRAAREIGNDIRTVLAVYFAREAEQA